MDALGGIQIQWCKNDHRMNRRRSPADFAHSSMGNIRVSSAAVEDIRVVWSYPAVIVFSRVSRRRAQVKVARQGATRVLLRTENEMYLEFGFIGSRGSYEPASRRLATQSFPVDCHHTPSY